jgi:hypothetical protein
MTKRVLRGATSKARTRCEFISGGPVSGNKLCPSIPAIGPNLKLDEPTTLWAAVHSGEHLEQLGVLKDDLVGSGERR